MMKTEADYWRLMLKRPVKFTPEEVGFVKAPVDDDRVCCSCTNWFVSLVMGSHVCQVMRPKTETEDVPADWTCQFWTRDAETFPKLPKEPNGGEGPKELPD